MHEEYVNQFEGQIQLIVGPMFSGKTTEMLRRIRRYTVAKRKCIVIKYEADKRYSDDCSTHDKHTHKAVACSRLSNVGGLDDVDVIGIDEGQFYPDLLEFCESYANAGKVIIVAALDATFQRKPFGSVCELVPLAERVTKLTAVCMKCHKSAAFTARIGSEQQVQLIGGTERYVSTCRTCFMQMSNQSISFNLNVVEVTKHKQVAQTEISESSSMAGSSPCGSPLSSPSEGPSVPPDDQTTKIPL